MQTAARVRKQLLPDPDKDDALGSVSDVRPFAQIGQAVFIEEIFCRQGTS